MNLICSLLAASLFLPLSFLYSEFPEKSVLKSRVVVDSVCLIRNKYGPIGSATYLCRINCAFYFLTNDHVVGRGYSNYLEVSGGRTVKLQCLCRTGDLAIVMCFLPEDAISSETDLSPIDPPPDNRIFLEGYPGGYYWRGEGTVRKYGFISVKNGFDTIEEKSIIIKLSAGHPRDLHGMSGSAVYWHDCLCGISWSIGGSDNKPPEYGEIYSIPASEIVRRLMKVEFFLPPDFTDKLHKIHSVLMPVEPVLSK